MKSRSLIGHVGCVLLLICSPADPASAQAAAVHTSVKIDAHLSDSSARTLALSNRSSLLTSIAEHDEHRSPRLDVAPAPSPIADNSFLIEEAYNQDAGTVQHISAFSRSATGDWAYGFTDEWAVRGQRHQLSATLPLARVAGDARPAWGLGDVALHYRYQISGVDGGRVAAAPRLTILAPTGSASRGLGAGATSLQAMLPVSIATGSFVTHLNAGVTRIGRPAAADASTPTVAWTLGHSLVWLATQRINLLLESVWTGTESRDAAGATSHVRQMVVSPGVRWSYDLPHDLQIVPGIAVPIGVGPSRGDRSLLLYLSFEHPYY